MRNRAILFGMLVALALCVPALSDDVSNGSYSTLDASNDAAPPNGWPAGMFPSDVEPSARANMGATKRWWERANPTLSTTGSAGAYVLTPSNTSYPTAYTQGEVYCAKANFTSVGNDTLNLNGLGAKPIYSVAGGSLASIAAGQITLGEQFCASYDASLNSGVGGLQLLTQSPITSLSGITLNNVTLSGTTSFPGGALTSAGNLGIGTASPGSNKLAVSDGTNVFAVQPGSTTYAGTSTNVPFSLMTNNSGRIFIATNGFVGDGISSPTEMFDAENANGVNVKIGNYSYLGGRYSAWDTWLTDNIRVATDATNNVQLASNVTAGGASALNIAPQSLAYYQWSPSALSGKTSGTNLTLPSPSFLIDSSGNATFSGGLHASGTITFDTALGLSSGGCGATTAPGCRSNLGLGSAATQNTGAFLQPGNNLSDVSSATSARSNLGLGSAATQNTTAFLQPGNNLSDVGNASTARSNLGIGPQVGAYVSFSISSGILSVLSESGVTSVTRSGTGTINVTLSCSASLPIGYAIGDGVNLDTGDGLVFIPPNSSITACNAYTFYFKYASSKTIADPYHGLILFY